MPQGRVEQFGIRGIGLGFLDAGGNTSTYKVCQKLALNVSVGGMRLL